MHAAEEIRTRQWENPVYLHQEVRDPGGVDTDNLDHIKKGCLPGITAPEGGEGVWPLCQERGMPQAPNPGDRTRSGALRHLSGWPDTPSRVH